MVPELPVAELIAGEALQPAATVSLMAGAMGQALALSIDHVNTRQQFGRPLGKFQRSEEHTSELQSLMRISYAVFCLKKKKLTNHTTKTPPNIHNKHEIDKQMQQKHY